MDPLSVLGIATVGSSLLGGLFGSSAASSSNRANIRAVREQNQGNMELAKYQNSRNLELWNMNNAYNTPSSQIARLRAAGLNPNLVYGSGGVVGNTTSPPPSTEVPQLQAYTNYRSPLGSWGNAVQDMATKVAQTSLISAQAKAANSQSYLNETNAILAQRRAELAASEKSYKDWNTKFLESSFRTRLEKLNLENQEINSRIGLFGAQKGMYNSTSSLNYNKILETSSKIDKIKADTFYTIQRSKLLPYEKGKLIAQSNLLYQQAEDVASQIFFRDNSLTDTEFAKQFNYEMQSRFSAIEGYRKDTGASGNVINSIINTGRNLGEMIYKRLTGSKRETQAESNLNGVNASFNSYYNNRFNGIYRRKR